MSTTVTATAELDLQSTPGELTIPAGASTSQQRFLPPGKWAAEFDCVGAYSTTIQHKVKNGFKDAYFDPSTIATITEAGPQIVELKGPLYYRFVTASAASEIKVNFVKVE